MLVLGKSSEAYASQAYRWAIKYFALLYGTPLPVGILIYFSAKFEIAKSHVNYCSAVLQHHKK